MAATEVLWAASGRRFGECTATGLLPCRDECEPGWLATRMATSAGADGWPWPTLISGQWFNLGCGGGCADGWCGCNTRDQFTLPGPVTRVVQIVVDGGVVPTGSYRLENHRHIVRIDGGSWPHCNDGSWTVDVVYGHEVPQLGLMAAAELACEMVKACTPGEECRLPARLQTISRQGITQSFIDPQEFLSEGRVGLYLSDLFIQTFNPSGLKSRPRVFSPDRRRRQVTSG
jgi:hypothetical protein